MKGTYLVHVDMVGPGHEGTFSLEAIVDAVAEIEYDCLEGQELDRLGGNDYCDLWNRMLAMSVGKRVATWQRWIDFRAYGPSNTPLWIPNSPGSFVSTL